MMSPIPAARRASRLTKEWEFRRVQSRGRSQAGRLLVVRVLPNRLEHNRWGIIVGKKVGKAVVRNRVRRRLRELLRGIPMASGWDGVVIARPPAAAATFRALGESLKVSLERLGILLPAGVRCLGAV